ncbi:22367_t:CDS:2, partial [Gigaspora margarita]
FDLHQLIEFEYLIDAQSNDPATSSVLEIYGSIIVSSLFGLKDVP